MRSFTYKEEIGDVVIIYYYPAAKQWAIKHSNKIDISHNLYGPAYITEKNKDWFIYGKYINSIDHLMIMISSQNRLSK